MAAAAAVAEAEAELEAELEAAEAELAAASAERLACACGLGRLDEVMALLQSGADVNAPNARGYSPLCLACQGNHPEVVSTLLSAGATIDVMALRVAIWGGHTDRVSMLLSAGADVDYADDDGLTLLCIACQDGRRDIASMLLLAGADVNYATRHGLTPLMFACSGGFLNIVQVLSSFGATRHSEARRMATGRGRHDVVAWLDSSSQWSTPLHHLSVIGADRARALLRGGADLHASANAAGPTPLSLARALGAAGDAADGSAAQLVLMAAEPWSPRSHALFPAGARASAVELLRLGHLLSRQPRFTGEEVSLSDIWVEFVMPLAVTR